MFVIISSHLQSEEMPRHAEPEEPLIFGVKEGVSEIPYPDHYTLQWNVPLDNGKEIDYFQINYYQVGVRACVTKYDLQLVQYQ